MGLKDARQDATGAPADANRDILSARLIRYMLPSVPYGSPQLIGHCAQIHQVRPSHQQFSRKPFRSDFLRDTRPMRLAR